VPVNDYVHENEDHSPRKLASRIGERHGTTPLMTYPLGLSAIELVLTTNRWPTSGGFPSPCPFSFHRYEPNLSYPWNCVLVTAHNHQRKA